MAKQKVSFKFKTKSTSEGYLAYGCELPGIIVETKTKRELVEELKKCTEFYFKSFPKERERFVVSKTEEIQQIKISI